MVVADVLSVTLLVEQRRAVSRELLARIPGFARWSPLALAGGIASGTWLLGWVPARIGRLALACTVLVFVAVQARRRGGAEAAERVTCLAAVEATAFGAGLVDGWIGTGGAVVALHLVWRRLAPARFMAAILCYFCLSDAVRYVAYAVTGYWSSAVAELILRAAPVALVGYLAGMGLRRRFASPRLFRAAVLVLLALLGITLGARALLERS
jgi:hypothetical protein